MLALRVVLHRASFWSPPTGKEGRHGHRRTDRCRSRLAGLDGAAPRPEPPLAPLTIPAPVLVVAVTAGGECMVRTGAGRTETAALLRRIAGELENEKEHRE